MTELTGPGVSGECHQRCGLHIAEDHFLPEIIDPDTWSKSPPGRSGELVVTNTHQARACPMLRYRTKDITRLRLRALRLRPHHTRAWIRVMGRTDDMLIIKGVNVFPTQIESVLVGMENIGPHYQLVVREAQLPGYAGGASGAGGRPACWRASRSWKPCRRRSTTA